MYLSVASNIGNQLYKKFTLQGWIHSLEMFRTQFLMRKKCTLAQNVALSKERNRGPVVANFLSKIMSRRLTLMALWKIFLGIL